MKTIWSRFLVACPPSAPHLPLLRRCVVLWLLALCLGSFNCLLAQPFFFRKDIRVGEGPYAVVTGDFNGDRRPDLAVGAQDGVYVLLNTGGGNFGRPIRTEAPPQTFWLGAGADFNGDGRDDLVGSGFLYLSRGDGTFQPPRYLDVQEAVAAGDFNRDGKTDLLISNREGVRVLLGNGDGAFQSGAVVTTAPMVWVQVADFNHDGRPDVATSFLEEPVRTESRRFLLVFLGQGDGTFGPEIRTEIIGGARARGPLVGDFNGDGLPDILTEPRFPAPGPPGPPGAMVTVMRGNGDGSFQSPIPSASEVYGVLLAAADFTGDGRADLVMAASHLFIRPGRADGTLSPAVDQPMAPSTALTAVDLDGDGRSDLVTANGFSNSVSVLMSRAEWRPEMRLALSAAIDLAIVAPASLATLYTPTPATASESASPPWPTRLGGISLEVRDSAGATLLASLLFVSSTQINFQVPAGAALGEATLAIADGGGTTLAGSMQVDAVAPSLFTAEGWPVFTGVLVEPDGAQVPVGVPECVPDWGCWPSPIPLSTAGDRPIYLSFYGTGFRGANTNNVTCHVQDVNSPSSAVQVPVVYAGPQETPGVDQINIRLLPAVLGTLRWDELEGWGALVTIRINGVPVSRASIWGN
jgi:uncharacterized protein (TIGR03437 family)